MNYDFEILALKMYIAHVEHATNYIDKQEASRKVLSYAKYINDCATAWKDLNENG